MNAPTPDSDPNGLAAAVVALATAVFAAVDPSGALGARWSGVILGAVAIGSILWARRRTWSPQAHTDAVGKVRRSVTKAAKKSP